jgi:hypothetical protein
MVRHNALFKITECLSRCERKDERGRIFATYGGKEKCIQSFGETVGRKVQLGRQRRRWENNIKTGLKEIE